MRAIIMSGLRPRTIAHRMAAMIVAVLATLLGFAAPASAATVNGGTLTVTHLSNGALQLNYNGHNYVCYSGDLCIYRGGYQTYYVCQSVSNAYTGTGWSVNNQSGSGGVARFIARNGASNWNQPIDTAATINWNYVKSITTCT
jgi:hypothetical protein